ncbi:MAG: polymer-forming cytoskeletal protein [Actinomycetota bacterium]
MATPAASGRDAARAGVMVAVALVGLSLGALAASGAARPAGKHGAHSVVGDRVVLSGDVAVPKGEVSGDVVIVHGSARVAGAVHGSVVVVDGDVVLSGLVRGDVVALDGPVRLLRGAHVTGDVWLAHGTLDVEVGAQVDGDVHRGGLSFLSPATLVTRLGFWIAISVSTLLLGLLLLLLGPRAADAVDRAGREAVGKSIGWGAALMFGLPVVGFLLLVSLVGIPFGIGLLLGLALLYSIGYAYAAWILGRAVIRRSRHGGPRRVTAFLAGWVILRAVGFVPYVGGITWFLAALYGLGAATVALWRARRGAPPTGPAAAPPLSPPEPEPTAGQEPPPTAAEAPEPEAAADLGL